MKLRKPACLTRFLAGPDSQTGGTLVEFALVLPTLILFLYGVIEFGRVLFTQGVLYLATEEATRFAAVNYTATEAQIQEAAESRFVLIDPAKITNFNVTSTLNAADQTKLVTVEITYAFEPLVPIGWSSIPLFGHSRGFLVL
jgi:Flp pilus assembly protein TadG